jgi:hypothetical protein
VPGVPGATGVHPEGVAPGGAPSFMRKVSGPPVGFDASAGAAAVGLAVGASGAAGVLALPEATAAPADAAAPGSAAALASAATTAGAAAAVPGAPDSVGGVGASDTSGSSAGVGAAFGDSGTDAAEAAPSAPTVADGPTGASFWAIAGHIAQSAISPPAKVGNIAATLAARSTRGERAPLIEAPAALMLDHASLVAELF